MFTFLRYIVSGGLATIVHYAILIYLVEMVNVNPTISTTIGFLAAVAVNYPLQYYWTFSSKTRHDLAFLRYTIVTLMTMLVNITIFWVLVEVLHYWYFMSQVVATFFVIVINYFINSKYTFNAVED